VGTNLWEKFKGILPGTPKMYCTVYQVFGDELQVTTNSGGTLQVLGSGWVVGDKVWVQDGQVVGKAPVLPHYDIDV
jgi:hypothetical protein